MHEGLTCGAQSGSKLWCQASRHMLITRFTQCEHAIDKLMQRGEQMELEPLAQQEALDALGWVSSPVATQTWLRYLFHEWSGVFPALPAAARKALAKARARQAFALVNILPSASVCPSLLSSLFLRRASGSSAVGCYNSSQQADFETGTALAIFWKFFSGRVELKDTAICKKGGWRRRRSRRRTRRTRRTRRRRRRRSSRRKRKRRRRQGEGGGVIGGSFILAIGLEEYILPLLVSAEGN